MALIKLSEYLAAKGIQPGIFRDQLAPLAIQLCTQVLTKEVSRQVKALQAELMEMVFEMEIESKISLTREMNRGVI